MKDQEGVDRISCGLAECACVEFVLGEHAASCECGHDPSKHKRAADLTNFTTEELQRELERRQKNEGVSASAVPSTKSGSESASVPSTQSSANGGSLATGKGKNKEVAAATPSSYDQYGFRKPRGTSGADYQFHFELPPEKLHSRIAKWREMLDSWPKWMSNSSKRKKIKDRVRKGIPDSLRGQAWQIMSGSIIEMQRNPGVFDHCLGQEPDPKDLDIIMRDLDRTYPNHILYEDKTGRGQTEMLSVLKAFAVHRPLVGYVQGMGMLVGMMVMHMPLENAFWLLVTVMDKYIPGMFDKKLSQFHIDCAIFQALLAAKMKNLSAFLNELMLDPIMYATKWFLCIYTLSLPWETVLRIWDAFFFEGVQVVFSVGLAIMQVCEKDIMQKTNIGDLISYMNNIPLEHVSPADEFLPVIFNVKVDRQKLIKEHYRQLEIWKETHGQQADVMP